MELEHSSSYDPDHMLCQEMRRGPRDSDQRPRMQGGQSNYGAEDRAREEEDMPREIRKARQRIQIETAQRDRMRETEEQNRRDVEAYNAFIPQKKVFTSRPLLSHAPILRQSFPSNPCVAPTHYPAMMDSLAGIKVSMDDRPEVTTTGSTVAAI